jgi:hypothetical protein
MLFSLNTGTTKKFVNSTTQNREKFVFARSKQTRKTFAISIFILLIIVCASGDLRLITGVIFE